MAVTSTRRNISERDRTLFFMQLGLAIGLMSMLFIVIETILIHSGIADQIHWVYIPLVMDVVWAAGFACIVYSVRHIRISNRVSKEILMMTAGVAIGSVSCLIIDGTYTEGFINWTAAIVGFVISTAVFLAAVVLSRDEFLAERMALTADYIATGSE